MHIPGYTSSPRSVGLPVTRNMPFSAASVPHRSRNMTGIYLGLEGNSKPPRSKSAIPPLARGRGMSRIRTPVEDRRYKMVEYLRIKEEKRGFTGGAIRGCKSASASSQDPARQSRDQRETQVGTPSKRRWGPGKRIDPSNVDDLIRPNPRNFTTVANSGVTRSEKLVGWSPMNYDLYSVVPADNVTDEVVEEVHKIASAGEELAGLEDCYNRICKAEPHPFPYFTGKVDTLYGLLPGRRAHQMSRRDIGFTVRSYRNPAKAEILAEFPDPLNPGRPKTVPIQRPLVPSPYFFNHSGLQGGAYQHHQFHPHQQRQMVRAGLAGQLDDPGDYIVVPRILAAPGAGGISKTLQYGTSPLLSSLQLLNGKQYMSQFPDTSRSADHIQDLRAEEPAQEKRQTSPEVSATEQKPEVEIPAAGPADETKSEQGREAGAAQKTDDEGVKGENQEKDEEKTEGAADVEEEKETMTSQVMIAVPGDTMSSTSSHTPRPRLTTSNSGADIMLGLETDEGKTAEVEIDSLESDELQPEEIPKGRVRKTSIVEKLSKSKESELIALTIMESAGQRQREFEKLISEHQELVHEISRTPSSENIVQSEDGRDP